ncbi:MULTISPECIES: CdaR family protein [Sporosarcina]|uniref:YbbR-like domain-containing protein n=1 Tax=Sporosarcina contaminans TaxID=633403 RepID=A0ABW3U1Q5_9BACL
MDKFMDRPWFLRITALILALSLFVTVKGEEDKSASNTFGDTVDIIRDVPLEVYYDNENLVVTGLPESVNVTVEGPPNIVQSLKIMRDFTVKADLRSLPMGSHKVEIQTENISDKLQVKLDPATVDVVIEEKITQSFKVDPEFNERLLAEDFHVVNMGVEPAAIEVTGAKSVIDSISFVKVSVTKDNGINKSFEQKARVRVLDRDLNKLNVTIEPEEVTVKVDIEENSKEVPIVVKQKGVAPDDISIDSVFSETKFITLYGPKKVLDSIENFNVDVDVTDVKKSGSINVELAKPKGVSKLSTDKIKVNIVASNRTGEEPPPEEEADITDDEVSKQYKGVPVIVKGLDESFKSHFQKPADGLIDITVTGRKEILDSLDISDFSLIVDASGTEEEGEHVYSVSLEAPAGIAYVLSDQEVTLKVELA